MVGIPEASEKKPMTVDKALQLIANNNTDGLVDHARALVLDILPLLEYADQVLELSLRKLNKNLRDQLKPEN